MPKYQYDIISTFEDYLRIPFISKDKNMNCSHWEDVCDVGDLTDR